MDMESLEEIGVSREELHLPLRRAAGDRDRQLDAGIRDDAHVGHEPPQARQVVRIEVEQRNAVPEHPGGVGADATPHLVACDREHPSLRFVSIELDVQLGGGIE